MDTNNEFPYLPLLCPSYLREIEHEGIRIVDLCDAIDAKYPNVIRHYPDGTLAISSREAASEFDLRGARAADRRLYQEDAERHGGSRGATRTSVGKARIRTLSAFPEELYVAIFVDEAARQLGDGTVAVINERATHGRLQESPLDALLVSIEFVRAVSKENRALFAALIDDYLSSMSQHGVFGEGPVVAASPTVDFSSKFCQFKLDAHLTGPHTINWLVLRLVSFLPRVAISCIFFTKALTRYNLLTRKQDAVSFEEVYGKQRWSLPLTATFK